MLGLRSESRFGLRQAVRWEKRDSRVGSQTVNFDGAQVAALACSLQTPGKLMQRRVETSFDNGHLAVVFS